MLSAVVQLKFDSTALITIFLLLASVIYCLFCYKQKLSNLPRGPIGLPILGYLPFLSEKPYKDFYRLSKKYGDVLGMKWGCNYVVVLNSSEAMKDAFSNDHFLGRPAGTFHLSDEYKTLLELEPEDWKEHKRFNNKALRALGIGQNQVEEMAGVEIVRFLDTINKQLNKDINIRKALANPINNIIFLFITGKTYEITEPMSKVMIEFQEIMNLIIPTSYALNLPFLSSLVTTKTIRTAQLAVRKMENTLRAEIKEHDNNLNEDNLNDYLDHFLLEIKKRNNGSNNFTKTHAIGIAETFLLGGSDTSLSTLSSVFLQMANDPDIQEKVYNEIIKVLGSERPPTWADKVDMPYTDAVLLESSRRNTVTPLGLPRRASQNTKILGFNIPKGTEVIGNIASIHMDPRYWKEPEKFIPERFLTDSGKVLPNLPNAFLPFSYGLRACPGDKYALVVAFLFFVSIIQKYRILPPQGGIRLESVNRGILSPAYPALRFENR